MNKDGMIDMIDNIQCVYIYTNRYDIVYIYVQMMHEN